MLVASIDETAEWLRKERERVGWTAAQLALQTKYVAAELNEEVSLTQQAVSHFETGKGKSIPRWVRFASLAIELVGVSEDARLTRMLELNPNYLRNPNGTTDRCLEPHQERLVDEAEGLDKAQFTTLIGFARAMRGGSDTNDAAIDAVRRLAELATGGDTVPVELLPTYAGAGGGGTGEGDVEIIRFPRNLIERELRATSADVLAVLVEGDSMEPMFVSGDQLLIDKRRTSITQPGAFCLWDGDGYVIKLLEKVYDSDPPKVRVLSKNAVYQAVERLAEEVRIMGRVVWFGRRV
jgi:phage repressor protein C with HTH and peptisase S24 domain